MSTPFAPPTSVAQPVETPVPQAQTATWSPAAPVAPASTSAPVPPVFTQEDVYRFAERVRQEEKDKLYPEISGLKETLAQLKASEDERKAREQAVIDEAKAAQDAAENEKLSAAQLVEKTRQEFLAQLNERDQNWNTKLEDEKRARESTEALLAKEREFHELREFTQGLITSNAENIAPQLVDLITGNTKEEIEQAVERAKAASAAIGEQFRQAIPGGYAPPGAVVGQAPEYPGVSIAAGPANMDTGSQYMQLTDQQLKDMPMSEYAKVRPQLIGRVSSPAKGLFG